MSGLPEAVRRAAARGHTVEWDPPAALTAAKRWTCTDRRCGAAVIDYCGHIYGRAVEQDCPGRLTPPAAPGGEG